LTEIYTLHELDEHIGMTVVKKKKHNAVEYL